MVLIPSESAISNDVVWMFGLVGLWFVDCCRRWLEIEVGL